MQTPSCIDSSITETNMRCVAEQSRVCLPEHQVHFLYPFLVAPEIERARKPLDLFGKTITKISLVHFSRYLADIGVWRDQIFSEELAWRSFEYAPEESESGSGENDKFFLPSADFLPHIAALSGGRAYKGKCLVKHWQLTENAREEVGRTLHSVPFNSPAARRLGIEAGESPLQCHFVNVFATAFSSGIGLLHVVVKYDLDKNFKPSQLIAGEKFIVEGNYALAHRKSTYGSPVARLVEGILASLGLADLELRRRRTFAFTGVAFSNPYAEADKLATRLSIKENTDYQLDVPDETACALWRNSPQVTHVMSPDGCAVLIQDCRRSNFLKNYLRRNMNTYLALARLALHESEAITQYSARLAALSCLNTLRSGEYAMLADIRRCLYQYRLNYRFSKISEEPRHNHAHQIWRKQLRLDSLVREVDADVGQVNAFAEANRFALWGRMLRLGAASIGACSAILATDTLFSFGWREHTVTWLTETIQQNSAVEWLSNHPLIAGIMASAIIALLLATILSPGRRPRDLPSGR